MIRETADADEINSFANHPEIAPHIGGGGLDLSAGIGNGNVFLAGAHGVFCFIWSAPETYEVHVMVTGEGRGRWAVHAARHALAEMDCKGMQHLWGRVHPERPEIASYARLCGLRDTGIVHTLDVGAGPVGWRIFNRKR